MLYRRQSDDYLRIAKAYLSDHIKCAYCLQQTLHCLLLYLTIHFLHLTLNCLSSSLCKGMQRIPTLF